MITVYLMAVEELDNRGVYEAAMGKVDRVRYHKVGRLRSRADKIRSLGAGLLLQYGIREAETVTETAAEQSQQVQIKEIRVQELLEGTWGPIELAYRYGDNGKPYLSEYPGIYFSLSHSGGYVICAISGRELGADIQEKKPQNGLRLAKRFFHEREKQLLESCINEKDKQEIFYRLWAAKEAYGKLTGKGIRQGFHSFYADFARNCIADEEQGGRQTACLWESEWQGKYRIAVCDMNQL